MAERSDPSALRWLIGAELADFRKQTGLSLSKVAARVGISKPKLSNMEAGRFQQYPDDVAKVLECYGVARRDIDRLCSLSGRSDERAWWAPWAHVVPDWVKTVIGLEGLATNEFVYEPTVIPGLLQTEDYAHALTGATGFVRADHNERFVSFRLARARRLTDAPQPLALRTIIGEAALRLAVGDLETRREQYRHLIKSAELPNVEIRIVRPEDGPHAAATGPFYIFDFELARSIAYAELLDGAMYIQDFDQVRTYIMAAESAQRVALSPKESVDFIAAMIDGG